MLNEIKCCDKVLHCNEYSNNESIAQDSNSSFVRVSNGYLNAVL